jgi:AbrB family looped-hinge helix DNA binding protein
MKEIKTKIAEGGRVVIPAEYRQALGLKIGDEVIIRLEEGALRIFTPDQAIAYAQELLRPYLPQGRSLSDELIRERRLEN